MFRLNETVQEYLKTFGTSILLAAFIITFIAQSHIVEGNSMQPTLHNGDRLMVDKISYRMRQPRYGEIVVFRYPANPHQRFIKRVVGLPGDTVEIKNFTLYLNGQPVTENYINGRMYGDFGPVTVPEGTVFVLGDNRNNSEDSRYADVGPVPQKLVVGRALFQYWPITRINTVHVPAVFAPINAGTK